MAVSVPADFAGAFGLLCGLLNERPLDLVQLRACFRGALRKRRI
jgi:hypothetical protein